MKSGVFLVLLVCVVAHSPGAKFYLGYRALDKLEKQILLPLLAGLDSVSLPDFQVETSLELSPTTVSVKNVKLGEVIVYSTEAAALVPPNRVNFELFLASAVISFDWEANCCTDTRGNGNIILDSSHIYTNFTLGEKKGQLTIDPEVEVAVGDLTASYEVSELKWLYEAILKLHGEQLKSDAKGIVQDRVETLLKEKIAELVGNPVYKVIKPSVIADFSLLRYPIVHSTYVEFLTKGEVYDSAAKQKPRFAPTPLPYEWENRYQMDVSADISLATIESLLAAASSSGQLKLALFSFIEWDLSYQYTTSYLEGYFPGFVDEFGDGEVYFLCDLHTTKGKGSIRNSYYGEFYFAAQTDCEMRLKGTKEPIGTVSGILDYYTSFSCDGSSIFLNVLQTSDGDDGYASVPALGLENVPFYTLEFLVNPSVRVLLPVKGLRLPNIGVSFCRGGSKEDYFSFYGLLTEF